MLSSKAFEVPKLLLSKLYGLEPITMAVAGINSIEMLESARSGFLAGVIRPLLIGKPERILQLAAQVRWSVDGFRVIDAVGDDEIAATAVALVRSGQAQAIMKGDIHTRLLLRAVLDRDHGLRTGKRLSHVFHMSVPGIERVLYITDAAVNVAPDAAMLCEIICNAVEMAQLVGVARPKVAVLSASEVVDAAMPSTLLAREASKLASERLGDRAHVQGPLALDLAVSPKAALHKHVSGAVVGHADILVVPNIETGNALFKMMVHFMSATAAGVVLGAQCPIAVTSRSDPPEAHLAAAVLCALLSKTSITAA
jgi:phosphate acetyltransferase